MPIRGRLVLVLLAAVACGGGDSVAPTNQLTDVQPPPGLRAEFTFFPVEMTADGTIEPLGHLNPSGHTLPTDHVYFYPVDYDRFPVTRDTLVRKVFAPAGGALFFIYTGAGPDAKLMFRVTKDFYYYLDHVFPRAGLKVGDVVKAGEELGLTGRGAAIDLGAFDMTATPIPYVQPKRYPDQTNYCVSPFRYFVEPLRSQLYARQRRKPGVTPVDPAMSFDVAGRLAGNWFEEGLPLTPDGSNNAAAWPHHLAFVYDNYDPSVPRVSIGGSIAPVFLGTIPPDAPRFESVSVASGKVTYSVRYTQSTDVQFGLMIVQMLADDRIRVEMVASQTLKTLEFTQNSHIYVR
jgi:hypothetical protein